MKSFVSQPHITHFRIDIENKGERMKFRVATGRMGGRTEGAHRLSISLRKKRKMRMRYSINDAGDIENRKLLVKDIPIDELSALRAGF